MWRTVITVRWLLLHGSDVREGTGWKVGSCYHSDPTNRPTKQPSNAPIYLSDQLVCVRGRVSFTELWSKKQPADYSTNQSTNPVTMQPTTIFPERSAGVRQRALQSSNWWREFYKNLGLFYLVKQTSVISSLQGDCLARELRRVSWEIIWGI